MYNTSFYYILYIIMLSWNLLRYWSCARRRTSTASCSVWWLWIGFVRLRFQSIILIPYSWYENCCFSVYADIIAVFWARHIFLVVPLLSVNFIVGITLTVGPRTWLKIKNDNQSSTYFWFWRSTVCCIDRSVFARDRLTPWPSTREFG